MFEVVLGVLHRAELGHQRYHRLLDENIAIPHKCQHQQQCGEDNHLVSCLCFLERKFPLAFVCVLPVPALPMKPQLLQTGAAQTDPPACNRRMSIMAAYDLKKETSW